jgi:hypothetical protein
MEARSLPPLAGEVRDGAECLQSSQNVLENGFGLLQDPMIPKATHVESFCLDSAISATVIATVLEMLQSITEERVRT